MPTSSRGCSASSAASTGRGPWPRSCRPSSRTSRPRSTSRSSPRTCPTRPAGSRWSGVAGYDSPFHVIELGVGIIGRSAASHETVFADDVLSDPDYRAARPDVRSEVAVPVLHGGELLGILNFEGTAERPIGPAHVAVAEMLAAPDRRRPPLGAARRRAPPAPPRHRAGARGQPRARRRPGPTPRGRIGRRRRARPPRCRRGRVRQPRRRRDVPRRTCPGRRGSGSGGPGGRTRRRSRRIGHPRWRPGRADRRRRRRRSASGCRSISRASRAPSSPRRASRADRPFSELELRMADLLVTQIGVALHNAELHARVSEAAVRDPLTGLLNRRFFDEAVETAFAAAARSDRELSLVVFDLDQFSEVNNVHGHAVGDAVLRRVARAMASVIRNGDILARYGGEEFVVIAPGASRDAGDPGRRAGPRRRRGRDQPADRRPRDPDHDLRRRRVTPRRRGRRPGALPGRRLRPARREARRPRPRGQRLEPRSGLADGAGQGAVEHVSERTPRCVSERAQPATPARAGPPVR